MQVLAVDICYDFSLQVDASSFLILKAIETWA